ncbi:16S rRNA (guanine(966)-N(2))-methyltransferase RsmD [Desulfurispira natronophila]|uniref:16S rRNA (Guanine(966)-N(2))-methyltransferase RsmD n=1 Tax=Desulfurispira natronophila TaxID=682562 RepID=A0A7W7Y5C4_9BACT|nr:16S rRNA (guanine(966)-N(2))-methyltransferase RsmD [Desulfurispira natronophila]MBB5022324.1 16S rRNA (guanine(966)-N(2))-methyltransferase RsmD [Desulfurispira natronophila]
MRIISGIRKGRRLMSPKGNSIRPTADAVRESLFNLLGQHLEGVRFLDLFGGSGSVGLEAASRGAQVTIVDNSPQAASCIEHNITHCKLTEQVDFLPRHALAYLRRTNEIFDVIFIDPPYQSRNLYADVMELVVAHSSLSPDGVLIAEHPLREAPTAPPGMELEQCRSYGKKSLSFFVLAEAINAEHPSTTEEPVT